MLPQMELFSFLSDPPSRAVMGSYQDKRLRASKNTVSQHPGDPGLIDLLTRYGNRPQERTHLGAGEMGNQRAQYPDCPPTVRRPLQIRPWRSITAGIGASDLAIHLCSSYPRFSLPRQGQREGILAR